MRSEYAVVALSCAVTFASADVFQWEYIDPGNPALGRRASTTLAPDGKGYTPAPDESIFNLDLTRAYLPGVDWTGAVLWNITLDDADLVGANFFQSRLRISSFAGADLTSADLSVAFISDNDFSNAVLRNADFEFSSVINVDFTGADLENANFARTTIRGTDFTGRDLSSVDFELATFENADMTNVVMGARSLNGSTFENVDFTGADLSGVSFHRGLTSVVFDNVNLSGGAVTGGAVNGTGTSFRGANLENASIGVFNNNLNPVDFTDAFIRGAQFGGRNVLAAFEQLASTQSYKDADLSNVGFGNVHMTAWDLSGQNLTGASFRDALLQGAMFNDANLSGAQFRDTVLQNVDFTNADLSGAFFRAEDLSTAIFNGALIDGADLYAATDAGLTQQQIYSTASYASGALQGVEFSNCDFSGWDFSNINFDGSSFEHVNLTAASLTGASFTGATLYRADLTAADARDASFANVDLERVSLANIQAAGADFSNVLFYLNDFTDADFSGASFDGAELDTIDASKANLDGATFRGALLRHVDLAGVSLRGADLRGSRFQTRSDELAGVDFTGANIEGAFFERYNGEGISTEQLYSTASYAARSLVGVGLEGMYVPDGWIFDHHDMTGASLDRSQFFDSSFRNAVLDGALLDAGFTRSAFHNVDLSTANLESSVFSSSALHDVTLPELAEGAYFRESDLRGATGADIDFYIQIGMRNLIRHDGEVRGGLILDEGQLMRLWDYNGAQGDDFDIVVRDELTVAAGARLRVLLEDDHWGSTIRMTETLGSPFGLNVNLAGLLEIDASGDADLASLLGQSFQIFDWEGVTINGAFADVLLGSNLQARGFVLDVSRLYTNGVVRLVPAPSAGALLVIAGAAVSRRRQSTSAA